MRLIESFTFSKPQEKNTWGEMLAGLLVSLYRNLIEVLNGGITFGDGTDTDNVRGQWISITTNSGAGVETEISHNLGEIPVGVIPMIPQSSGTMVKGSTAWTSEAIYLTFSAASQDVTLFLVAPPRTS